MSHPPTTLAAHFVLAAAALAGGLAPVEWLPARALRLRVALRNDGPNRADYERTERGYYEHLVEAGRRLGDPAGSGEPAAADPNAVPFDAGPLADPVADLREYALKPGLATVHWGVRWSTNAFGLRDREYAAAKPPGTMRVAFVGDSIGAGWGVDDGDGFEPRLEAAWDARSRAAGGPAVEVLNFAVPGLAPGQRWATFTRRGWGLGTDLVLYEATEADPGWDERRLRGLLARGLAWDSPLYRDALAQAGARPGGDPEWYKRQLRPYRWTILEGVYRRIVADCRARGVPAAWVLIPRVGKPSDPGDRARLVALARRAGFDAVLDLSDVYDGLEPAALAIAPTDYHPNAEGHALLARRLDAALSDRPELRRPRTPGPRAGADAR